MPAYATMLSTSILCSKLCQQNPPRPTGEPYDADQLVLFLCKLWLLDFGFYLAKDLKCTWVLALKLSISGPEMHCTVNSGPLQARTHSL